jgi:hypothetical protein
MKGNVHVRGLAAVCGTSKVQSENVIMKMAFLEQVETRMNSGQPGDLHTMQASFVKHDGGAFHF